MKQCSNCQERKAIDEFHRRAAALDGRQRYCKKCAKTRFADWCRANPKKRYTANANWHKANAALSSARRAKWAVENPARLRAHMAARKARMLRATPAWANQFFIEEIYDLAQRRTKLLGDPWEVDHIVPLKSPRVCGLHVEYNLRVIPKSINLAKGNRHWPDMPAKEQL